MNKTVKLSAIAALVIGLSGALTGCAPTSTTTDIAASSSAVREAAIVCPERTPSDQDFIMINNNLNVDIKFFSEFGSDGCGDWSGGSNPTAYNGQVIPSGGNTGSLRLERKGAASWTTTFMLMTGNVIKTVSLMLERPSCPSDSVCDYNLWMLVGNQWKASGSLTLNDIDGSGSGGTVTLNSRTLTFTCKDKSQCPSS